MYKITKIAINDREHGRELENRQAGLDYIRKHTENEIENVSLMFARDYWHTALGLPHGVNYAERDGVIYRLTSC